MLNSHYVISTYGVNEPVWGAFGVWLFRLAVIFIVAIISLQKQLNDKSIKILLNSIFQNECHSLQEFVVFLSTKWL